MFRVTVDEPFTLTVNLINQLSMNRNIHNISLKIIFIYLLKME